MHTDGIIIHVDLRMSNSRLRGSYRCSIIMNSRRIMKVKKHCSWLLLSLPHIAQRPHFNFHFCSNCGLHWRSTILWGLLIVPRRRPNKAKIERETLLPIRVSVWRIQLEIVGVHSLLCSAKVNSVEKMMNFKKLHKGTK